VREQHGIVRGGVLVPAGDVASLKGTLRALLRHSSIRMAFGREGRDRSRTRLHWADTSRAVRSAIGLAMDRAPAPAGSRP
jgi:glycosyltransferase involved in cell wall biosynthesis